MCQQCEDEHGLSVGRCLRCIRNLWPCLWSSLPAMTLQWPSCKQLCLGISPPLHDILSHFVPWGFSATSTWEAPSNQQGLWANQGVWENECPLRQLMISRSHRWDLGSRTEPRRGARGHNWCDQCSNTSLWVILSNIILIFWESLLPNSWFLPQKNNSLKAQSFWYKHQEVGSWTPWNPFMTLGHNYPSWLNLEKL